MEFRQLIDIALKHDFDRRYFAFCKGRQYPTTPPNLPLEMLQRMLESKPGVYSHNKKEGGVLLRDLVKVSSSNIKSYGIQTTIDTSHYRIGRLHPAIYPMFFLKNQDRRFDANGGYYGTIAWYAHASRQGLEEPDRSLVVGEPVFSNERELREAFEFVFRLYDDLREPIMSLLAAEYEERAVK